MTRTKFWRLSLAAILGFGWLFITPAYSDDPLSLAAQEIQELNASVSKLNYTTDFEALIDIAESKYDDAVDAKDSRDDFSDAYDAAVAAEAVALQEKTDAQTDVDNKTPIVANALLEKNSAQDDLDISTVNLTTANTNLQTAQSAVNNAGNQGVSFQIYPLSRTWNGTAYIAEGAGLMCQGSISSLNVWAGWGAICGLHDNIIGIFTTTLTIPEGINTVKFAGYTDDGFKLYVDGVLATSQWQEQGSTWSPYTQWFDTSVDKTLELQAWWYNGGGPGNMHVGWGHSNIWTGIPAEYLSYGSGPTQEQLDNLTAAQAAKTAAQEDYDSKLATRNIKLSTYNKHLAALNNYNESLSSKTTAYENAQTNTSNALQDKQESIEAYNQSIIDLNNAIDNAWEYFEIQSAREVASALAQAAAAAAANQPTPEPSLEPTPEPTEEVSPEPSPEPSPEQSEPEDPNPTPSSDTKDEEKPEPTPTPEPSPEPTPEPSPQPTDTNPEPTPEPEPTPAEPSEEPTQDNTTIDEESNIVIPEKGTGTSEDLSGIIANLTSKDNKLVVLTPEQVSAVSQTLKSLTSEAKVEVAKDLGIKPSEVEKVAEAMKDNPAIATAFVEFKSREAAAENATMPYTLADATTEVQTEAFLADPIGALTSIDLEKVLNPSEWGKDMTDDQREKAQEVVIPVIIASNIVAAAMTRRI